MKMMTKSDSQTTRNHSQSHLSGSGILTSIDQRKQFVNFTEDDIRELTAMKAWGNKHVGPAADNFYDHLEKFDTPMNVISAAGSSLDRLRNTQEQYLVELFDGEYGEAHFRRRYQIGVRHDLIGLTPRWYIGGFSIHFQNLLPPLVRRYWWRPKKLVRTLLALNKILNLDEQIAIDTYFDLRSSKVASTSTQIAETTREMSKNARSQSDGILQTSASMEEMTASITQVSTNASATMKAAQTATQRARSGASEIQEVATRIQKAQTTVGQLRARADTIGKVIELIQEIASQTNILALNAAIEAAGAGEAGARFNVVAGEIRKLAGRTAQSTTEITAMIQEIREDTSQVSSDIEQSATLAGSAQEAISDIVGGIQEVQNMVAQIAAAAEEQARTSSQVADTLTTLAQASQQISGATDQTALATQDLSQMADKLRG